MRALSQPLEKFMHNTFIPVDTVQHVFKKSKLILFDRSTVLKSAQSQLSNKLTPESINYIRFHASCHLFILQGKINNSSFIGGFIPLFFLDPFSLLLTVGASDFISDRTEWT